ncbi:HEAT repeat-containing protein 1-like [Diadema antillarum]|uniref:HEAT repeat-containing protein 1-like n=1 Tax=Diadema antillarum TaxID=105358 RepID=UPI003A862F35
MSSLAEQLQRLAVPEARASDFSHRKQRVSLLFDPAEAAGIDKETFYAIGVNGLQELQSIDPRFHDFEGLLFDEASKSLERSVQTKDVNSKLDKKIRRFLLVASPYFLLKPAQKAIEWLVFRFRIHEYNADELMMCVLPYHETKVFVRAVQLLNLRSSQHKWHWMQPIQKPGVSLSRQTLVTHCLSDHSFLHFICELPILAVKAHKKTSAAMETEAPPSDAPLHTVFSFYATTVVSAIATPTRVGESFLATLVPFLFRGLKQSYPDYNGATYMIICQLGVSAALKNSLLEPLMEAMVQQVKSGMIQEMLGCLTVLCQTQNLKQLPGKVLFQLCALPQFLKSLTQLSQSHNTLPLLAALLPQLTGMALQAEITRREDLPEGCKEVDLLGMLSGILKDIRVESEIVVKVARSILCDYVAACAGGMPAEVKGQLQQKLSPIVQTIERRFPEAMDLVLETYLSEEEKPDRQEAVQDFVSMYSGSTKYQVLPQSNTSLVLSLNHASPDVRRMAVNHVRALIKKVNDVDSFLRESLLQRLQDDSVGVVNAVMEIDEYLCYILPVEPVFEAMKKLIRKFRRKSGHEWNVAISGALNIITSCTFSSRTRQLVEEAIAMTIPFFFTSVPENAVAEHLMISRLAESYLVTVHPALKGLKAVLTPRQDADESQKTAKVVDLLGENIANLKQEDRDKLILALLSNMTSFSRPEAYCLLVETILLRALQHTGEAGAKLDLGTKLLGLLAADVKKTCQKQLNLLGLLQEEQVEEEETILQPISMATDPLPTDYHQQLVKLLTLRKKHRVAGTVYLHVAQVHTIGWLLESLVLSMAPLSQQLTPGTKWWVPGAGTDDLQGQYVTFLLQLLDILLEGSMDCRIKSGPCPRFREAVQGIMKHHFPNLPHFVNLLQVGWMGHVTSPRAVGFVPTPMFQVRCLNMGAVLHQSLPQDAVLKLLEKESITVPTLLIALSSPLEPVRVVALKCLAALGDSYEGNGPTPYSWLVHRLLKKKEELSMDADYVKQALGNLLMKANRAPVVKTPSKKKRGAAAATSMDVKVDSATQAKLCLEWLLDCVKEKGEIPHHAQTSLLGLLQQVDSKLLLSSVLAMFKDLLVEFTDQGFLDEAQTRSLHHILGHVTPLTADEMANSDSLDLFLRVLSKEDPTTQGMDSPRTVALLQLSPAFYLALPSDDVQQKVLSKLIDLQVDTERSATAGRIAKVIKKLPFTAAQIVTELSKICGGQKPKSLKEVKKARQKQRQASEEEAAQAVNIEGRPWQRVTAILEMLQQKKLGKIADLETLVPTVFTILSLCLDLPAAGQGSSEYIKQLLLTTLSNICNHLEAEGAEQLGKLKEEQFNVELVVQCIRTSDSPQTHNHALILLATAAKIFPEHVLHNIMAIFTFMGASLLRLDDSHSFQVIHKTVQTVIPALVKASKDQSLPSSLADNLEDVVTMVMQTFVDAFPHIPEHRRLPLFTHMVESVGGPEYLWRVVLLLITGYVTKGGAAMLPEETETKGPGRNLDFWLALCHHFDPKTQVTSLVNILVYLATLKEQKAEAPKTPSRTTRSTRSTGAAQRSEVAPQDLIFDVKHHTPRQLRHFQFTSVGYLSQLLTSDTFIGQLVDLTEPESAEMKSLYQKLLEQTLCYITYVAQCIHDNTDPNTAKFWRALLHKAYEVLDKVNSLLPARVFIQVVSGLLGNRLPTIRRKAMELLNNKLVQHKEGFQDEEIKMLLGMVDTLVSIVSSRESTDSADELDINRQTALFSLKLLCKLFGSDHRREFTSVLEVALSVVSETNNKSQVLASGLLCVAETVGTLAAHAIPYLSRFMPLLLESLSSKTHIVSSDLHLLSTVTAVQKTLETLPHFLSPYLGQLLEQVCRLSAARQEEEKAQLTLRLKACRHQLATALPSRVLIPAVVGCYKTVVDTNKASIGPLMSILGEHLGHLSKEDLLAHHHAMVNLFLTALDYRSSHPEDSLDEVADIEGHVIAALLDMVLRLSEATFRPMYLKLYEWASRSHTPHRLLTFYRLSDSIADRLKSLFSLFAGHVISNMAQLLDANNVAKEDKPSFEESEASATGKASLLLGYILDCLHKCFLYDKGDFVTKERSERLMQPLVDQIDNTLGGDDSYQDRITGHLTPCLVHFMVAARDPSTWQPLNYQVLLKTRSSSPKVRYAALTVLQSLHRQLGEDYLSLLPETIPFLAELMEDESEEVEHHCQDVVAELEKTLGEPLQKYF